MTPWLTIIGVGAAGADELAPGAAAIVRAAKVVIGPERLLDGTLTAGVEHVAWPTGVEAMRDAVLSRRGTPVVVLASGDPLWYGMAATLARDVPAAEMAVFPSPSSMQLAAARMRWPLQHVAIVSLHGRPVELLHPHLLPGNRILALTADRTTLAAVREILSQRGYGQSVVTVLENLGAADERVFDDPRWEPGDLYILAIDCVADADAPLLPTVAGLPDSAFTHDGQLTKREVRAVTLARLSPYPGAMLWDIGAGCGSVAIEWMRAARDARAVAIEPETARLAMIRRNALSLGVPGLIVVAGSAPGSLSSLPQPDAVFHGGAIAEETIFRAAWEALRSGGRFVANAVTLDGEAALLARSEANGGELARIEVSALDKVGGHRVLRPRMAVLQWSVTKP